MKKQNLYTGKGDNGTTKTYGCNQRISKSSTVAEALGTLDEINSYLGVCKTMVSDHKEYASFKIGKKGTRSFSAIVHQAQENLFKVQAQVAGFPMEVKKEVVTWAEELIHIAEEELPPIKTFFISGGTRLAASFDFARTLARRAERRVVAVSEEGIVKISPETLAYLNRLSSLLYALARLSNHKSGITDKPPTYQ